MTLDAILEEVDGLHPRFVTVTGGEPLAQKPCRRLLSSLCDAGYEVSLETSGAMDVTDVDPRISVVLDIKTPGSGEEPKNRYENIACLAAKDQVKFVICDRADYDWACEKLETVLRDATCEILFSPEHEGMNATELAHWILIDRLSVRMQIQLHKYLWGNERGR